MYWASSWFYTQATLLKGLGGLYRVPGIESVITRCKAKHPTDSTLSPAPIGFCPSPSFMLMSSLNPHLDTLKPHSLTPP